MADQFRRGYEDDRQQGGRGWTDRAGDEVRTWFGDDDARVRRNQEERQQPGGERERSWRAQGDGNDDRNRGQYSQGNHYGPQGGSYRPQGGSQFGQGSYGQGQPGQYGQYGQGHYGPQGSDQYGPYSGSQYGGTSSYGRGYPETDFMPHPVGSSNRESNQRDGGRDDWRTSGSSGDDQRRWGGEPSWGSSGSYGRSQGAGSFGGNSAGSNGGDTRFGSRGSWGGAPGGSGQSMRESYSGRGPKDYKRSDDRIREDVSDRLEQDHGVDASEISVQVQDGEVTLTGMVTSRDQKRRAEDCVDTVSGVREVTNNLRVNRSDARSQQAPASETSSSILGLGGQKSRESDGSSATQSAPGTSASAGKPADNGTSAKTGKANSGSSGLSA